MEDIASGFSDFLQRHESRINDLRYQAHLFRQSLLAMVGLLLIILVVAISLFAPEIAPHDPDFIERGGQVEEDWGINFGERFLAPSWEHPFGTNEYGADVLSMVIYGLQKSLRVGLIVVISGTIIGTVLGAVAGYYGGALDEVIMRVTDVFLSIPALILSLAVVAALGRSLENIMYALIIVWWPIYTRIIRGQVLSVRENQYVEAARSVGASGPRVIFKHVLPNAFPPVLVQSTLDMGNTILVAAGLSFLGLGPPPGTAELGLMVSVGQDYFPLQWWYVTFPGLAILFMVLGFNLLGDGLRDILDPKLRR